MQEGLRQLATHVKTAKIALIIATGYCHVFSGGVWGLVERQKEGEEETGRERERAKDLSVVQGFCGEGLGRLYLSLCCT